MANKYTGYHFVGDKLRDGRPVPADGLALRHRGPVKICEAGLHWSEHPLDALQYAPGFTLCRVECSRPVHSHNDKHVSRRRTIIARRNARAAIIEFAAWCAARAREHAEAAKSTSYASYADAADAAEAAAYAAATLAAEAASYAASADAAATLAAEAAAAAAAYAAAAYADERRLQRDKFQEMVDRLFSEPA